MPETEAPVDNSLLSESQPETTSSWYSDEYKDVVQRTGWKDPNDAIKSYRELEKNASSKVKLPSPESSAEEIRAFYQRTGCPENPEGYEVAGLPEEMPDSLRYEEAEKALAQIAYENGVNKQAFESLVKGFYEKTYADMLASREQGETALKQEFGDKYDENLNAAKKFCGNCSEEFRQLLEQTGLGNNPIVIKEFCSLGKKTMADSLVRGEPVDEDKVAYRPQYPDSPDMYVHGEDEESKKARAYFENKGHKY